MMGVTAHRRPHYPPVERRSILELRTVSGRSLAQAARTFLVTFQTIATLQQQLEEQGADALVQLTSPVNKFPEYVGYLVRRLRTLCPTLGKRKLAEVLGGLACNWEQRPWGECSSIPLQHAPGRQPRARGMRAKRCKLQRIQPRTLTLGQLGFLSPVPIAPSLSVPKVRYWEIRRAAIGVGHGDSDTCGRNDG